MYQVNAREVDKPRQGGTGSNLEFFGPNLNHWGKVVVLDLCPSLAETARRRVCTNGWEDIVDVVVGDACDSNCQGMPAAGTVDVVTFSYALTMIPDWKEAIRNAHRLLKPVSTNEIACCQSCVTTHTQYLVKTRYICMYPSQSSYATTYTGRAHRGV